MLSCDVHDKPEDDDEPEYIMNDEKSKWKRQPIYHLLMYRLNVLSEEVVIIVVVV